MFDFKAYPLPAPTPCFLPLLAKLPKGSSMRRSNIQWFVQRCEAFDGLGVAAQLRICALLFCCWPNLCRKTQNTPHTTTYCGRKAKANMGNSLLSLASLQFGTLGLDWMKRRFAADFQPWFYSIDLHSNLKKQQPSHAPGTPAKALAKLIAGFKWPPGTLLISSKTLMRPVSWRLGTCFSKSNTEADFKALRNTNIATKTDANEVKLCRSSTILPSDPRESGGKHRFLSYWCWLIIIVTNTNNTHTYTHVGIQGHFDFDFFIFPNDTTASQKS